MEQTEKEIIRKIRRDYERWTSPVSVLFGESVGKEEGYMLTRVVTKGRMEDGSLGDLDAQLTRAVDADKDVEAWLCHQASVLLYKLAETEPLDWFPKELAMLASVKLQDLATAPPPRHKGRNSADTLSRDYFLTREVLEVCKEYGLRPTRGETARFGDPGHESACSYLARALRKELNLGEHALNDIWRKRARFGVS
jgi:hypothetical protein